MTNFPRTAPGEVQAPAAVPARKIPLRRQLVNLALIFAAVVIPFAVTGKGNVLLMITCLAFFIMFHEFAHFIVAKMSGMKATEFFIGFGPRLFSVRKGETEYGIKAFPVGGYVKIVGMSSTEVVDPADEARTYRRARWYRRVATILAGPASHFLMAFLLLISMYAFAGTPTATATLGGVVRGLPADKAGIRVGDTIVSVQGVETPMWGDVLTAFGEIKTPVVTVGIRRADGSLEDVTVNRAAEVVDGVSRYRMGVETKIVNVREPMLQSVGHAGSTLKEYSVLTVGGIVRFFTPSTLTSMYHQVIGAHSAKGAPTMEELESRPTSIIGMTQVGADAAHRSWFEFIEVLVVINLALGSFNLLPMLPLDGGHIVIATYESVIGRFRKRRHYVNMARLTPVVAAFFGMLMLLGLSAMYLDIVRPAF